MHNRQPVRFVHVVQLLVVSLLLYTVPAQAMDDTELGRLFTSPKERATLDKLRLAKPKKKQAVKAVQEEPEAEIPLRAFRYDGVVIRNNGASTAWVNGDALYHQGRTADGVGMEVSSDSGELNVSLPKGDRRLQMKAGERFDPVSSTVNHQLTPATEGHPDRR